MRESKILLAMERESKPNRWRGPSGSKDVFSLVPFPPFFPGTYVYIIHFLESKQSWCGLKEHFFPSIFFLLSGKLWFDAFMKTMKFVPFFLHCQIDYSYSEKSLKELITICKHFNTRTKVLYMWQLYFVKKNRTKNFCVYKKL